MLSNSLQSLLWLSIHLYHHLHKSHLLMIKNLIQSSKKDGLKISTSSLLSMHLKRLNYGSLLWIEESSKSQDVWIETVRTLSTWLKRWKTLRISNIIQTKRSMKIYKSIKTGKNFLRRLIIKISWNSLLLIKLLRRKNSKVNTGEVWEEQKKKKKQFGFQVSVISKNWKLVGKLREKLKWKVWQSN